MNKPLLVILLCIMMLFSVSAIAEVQDETQITDMLVQAGVSEPVQLSQWQSFHCSEHGFNRW